ncbi:uncharacterized protein LOC100183578 isoform X1 [Ciona intestinalis]
MKDISLQESGNNECDFETNIEHHFDQSDASILSTTSVTSTRSESAIFTPRISGYIRNDPQRRSLKETILLRKFENRRGTSNRWNTPNTSPADVAKEELDKASLFRQRLLKNQEELHKLLSQAPFVLSKAKLEQKNQPVKEFAVKRVDNSDVTHHHCYASINAEDSSSSDEELREPMADTPPNLSDEESVETFRSTSPVTERNDVMTNDVIGRPRNIVTDSTSKKCVVSIARTASRTNMLRHRRGSNTSPNNALYEAAKPRPPPRKLGRKTPPIQKTVSISDSWTPDVAVETVTSSETSRIVTLPYVSRSSGKITRPSQSKRNNRHNDVIKEISDAEKDVTTHNGSYDVTIQHAPMTKEDMTKADTSPSRCTVSSSGYSSPGSSNGSASLSPSSSNASAASARSLALPRVQEIPNEQRDRSKSEPISKEVKTDDISVGSGSNAAEDEDVFPITTWVESPEFKNLELQTQVASELPEVDTKQKRLSAQSDDLSQHVVKMRQKTPQKRPVSAYLPSTNKPDAQQHVSFASNSICMIEPSTPKTMKNRVKASNSTKIRLPNAVSRSKKNAASRNSRAFALQAGSQIDLSVIPDDVETNDVTSYEPRRSASLSPKTFQNDLGQCYITEDELSASLANVNLPRNTSPNRAFNTVSGATGRFMTKESEFFADKGQENTNNNHYESQQSMYTGSTWSLNPSSNESSRENSSRKSLRARLKGAFSFQNIRRAISMETLDEEGSKAQRSVSHYYLNECGENVGVPGVERSSTLGYGKHTLPSAPVRKSGSISSILSTVRMRKRRSRERRAAKARNTIAVDPRDIPEYETPVSVPERPRSVHGVSDTIDRLRNTGVGNPNHFRPIGRVLQMDPRECSVLVEMVKPPSGPYGFYLARRKGDTGSVYISSLSDSYPDKMYAGLMKLGDEITEVNGNKVELLTLNEVYDIILDSDKLLLRIKPSQVHTV